MVYWCAQWAPVAVSNDFTLYMGSQPARAWSISPSLRQLVSGSSGAADCTHTSSHSNSPRIWHCHCDDSAHTTSCCAPPASSSPKAGSRARPSGRCSYSNTNAVQSRSPRRRPLQARPSMQLGVHCMRRVPVSSSRPCRPIDQPANDGSIWSEECGSCAMHAAGVQTGPGEAAPVLCCADRRRFIPWLVMGRRACCWCEVTWSSSSPLPLQGPPGRLRLSLTARCPTVTALLDSAVRNLQRFLLLLLPVNQQQRFL